MRYYRYAIEHYRQQEAETMRHIFILIFLLVIFPTISASHLNGYFEFTYNVPTNGQIYMLLGWYVTDTHKNNDAGIVTFRAWYNTTTTTYQVEVASLYEHMPIASARSLFGSNLTAVYESNNVGLYLYDNVPCDHAPYEHYHPTHGYWPACHAFETHYSDIVKGEWLSGSGTVTYRLYVNTDYGGYINATEYFHGVITEGEGEGEGEDNITQSYDTILGLVCAILPLALILGLVRMFSGS